MRVRSQRWRGALSATVVLAIFGLVWTDPVLLVAATIPLVFLVFAMVQSRTTRATTLTARRSISPTPTVPGRAVTITLEVTNASERTLSDVRIVDGVPAALAVTDGLPRAGTALEAGETVTLEYTVISRRGEYPFSDPAVRIRGIGGDVIRTVAVEPTRRQLAHLSTGCRGSADRSNRKTPRWAAGFSYSRPRPRLSLDAGPSP
ncbi:MAG: hypothetical protein U5K37_13320 [Natrialbaceae archaeon]|nr:hypothetical protein [Natrialbaceae archaeon]